MKTFGLRGVIVDERGLTLAEILVAVAVIGIGLVGVAVIIPVSTYGVQDGGQLSTATFLAEQMIERARAAAWTDPAVDCLGVSSGDSAPQPSEAACQGVTATQFSDELDGVRGHPDYRRTVRVSGCEPAACAGVTGTGIRLVTVTVSYTPLTVGGGPSPNPRVVRLEWLASRK